MNYIFLKVALLLLSAPAQRGRPSQRRRAVCILAIFGDAQPREADETLRNLPHDREGNLRHLVGADEDRRDAASSAAGEQQSQHLREGRQPRALQRSPSSGVHLRT